ncbi:zinc finger matrin-type protein 4 isoform X2 [Sinocyclocheilus grahami]|uniref:zinc finger matrin-type protein 4 isoform X2 n=1 Tax=Sinocyclocheilus grahami TaxID=75366 RepID=UPI0007AD6526|nr:PREDICTED: zinc finger matrin-type protein 4-like isoform X2 [Sinocyclocheilus grahami]
MDCAINNHLPVCPDHLHQGYSLKLQMKSTEVDPGLFTDSYCKVCSAQLISESQRVAHYEGSVEGDVDKNKCCTLCNMSFTSAVVAQSHYQGKIHAKRLRLLLGEPPAITSKEVTANSEHMVTEDSPGSPSIHGRLSHRYCQMCKAWFNNPGMARQHYDGKKHKKNAAQANLLAQLGKSLEDEDDLNGLKRSHTCEVCSVTLNSVAQYHAHLQGSKHQNNLKNK